MSKFIKISVLDSDDKANDYQVFLRPSMVMRVDTATPQERKRRPEANAMIICAGMMGTMLTNENAQQLINRIEEQELVGS